MTWSANQNLMLSADATSATEFLQAEISRDILAEALTAVSAAQTDGDVGWIQLEFKGNGLVQMSAVSHNLSIKTIFNAEYDGIGAIKVSGKQLFEYVKQLPPEKIKFKVESSQKMSLRCGRSSAKIQLIQDQTLSDIQVPASGTCIVVKGEILERWVNSFRDFVSVDDTRFYANGALIWADGSDGVVIHAVASDAMRLAKTAMRDDFIAQQIDASAVLVPKKALDEVRRLCSLNPSAEYTLKWNQETAFFAVETANYTMISNCIAGKYPPYTSAIPNQINTEIEVDLKSLAESVRRVLLFADKNRIIKLQFDGPTLDVQSFTPGLKEGEEIITLEVPAEQALDVNYNGTLLTGILNALSGSKIKFSWENTNRPVKITGASEKGLEVFYLLVPTRF